MIACEECGTKAKVIIIYLGKNLCLSCLEKKYPIVAKKFKAQFKGKVESEAEV